MDIFQLAHNDFNWNEARIKMDRAMLVDDEHSDTYWKPENVGQIYSLNSLNYRTDEILENRDLIFAGCSNTFGQGLTNDAIWTTQVSSHLKISNYNLGVCGTSTMSIINNLFNYFQKIGNPKILMCIFPDFLRMDVWSNSDHMNGLANITWNREYEKKEIKYHLLMDDAKRYKFSKQPHVAEDIIPEQLPFALSIQYIKMLETYCNAVGIKLIWSTWEHRQEKYILNNKKEQVMKFTKELKESINVTTPSAVGYSTTLTFTPKNSTLPITYSLNVNEGIIYRQVSGAAKSEPLTTTNSVLEGVFIDCPKDASGNLQCFYLSSTNPYIVTYKFIFRKSKDDLTSPSITVSDTVVLRGTY